MRIVRFQTQDSAPQYGWILDDMVGGIQGDPFGRYRRRDAQTPLSDVKLLAPCVPSKIVCVGRNYVEHAKELGNDVPKIPLIFLKPPSSIINPGDTIVLPPQSKQVEHEAELVAVVGKRARNVTAEQAKKHIFGYTVGNDVTARDLQKTDDQWTRAKGFDTFCPFGPWIDTEFNVADALITCKVNWAAAPDGLHTRCGLQRGYADRLHLLHYDARARGPDLHRHAGGRRRPGRRQRGGCRDRGPGGPEEPRKSGRQIDPPRRAARARLFIRTVACSFPWILIGPAPRRKGNLCPPGGIR